MDQLDKAVAWMVDRHFDVVMTVVVETRGWLNAAEELVGDVEHWLWRQQHMIR